MNKNKKISHFLSNASAAALVAASVAIPINQADAFNVVNAVQQRGLYIAAPQGNNTFDVEANVTLTTTGAVAADAGAANIARFDDNTVNFGAANLANFLFWNAGSAAQAFTNADKGSIVFAGDNAVHADQKFTNNDAAAAKLANVIFGISDGGILAAVAVPAPAAPAVPAPAAPAVYTAAPAANRRLNTNVVLSAAQVTQLVQIKVASSENSNLTLEFKDATAAANPAAATAFTGQIIGWNTAAPAAVLGAQAAAAANGGTRIETLKITATHNDVNYNVASTAPTAAGAAGATVIGGLELNPNSKTITLSQNVYFADGATTTAIAAANTANIKVLSDGIITYDANAFKVGGNLLGLGNVAKYDFGGKKVTLNITNSVNNNTRGISGTNAKNATVNISATPAPGTLILNVSEFDGLALNVGANATANLGTNVKFSALNIATNGAVSIANIQDTNFAGKISGDGKLSLTSSNNYDLISTLLGDAKTLQLTFTGVADKTNTAKEALQVQSLTIGGDNTTLVFEKGITVVEAAGVKNLELSTKANTKLTFKGENKFNISGTGGANNLLTFESGAKFDGLLSQGAGVYSVVAKPADKAEVVFNTGVGANANKLGEFKIDGLGTVKVNALATAAFKQFNPTNIVFAQDGTLDISGLTLGAATNIYSAAPNNIGTVNLLNADLALTTKLGYDAAAAKNGIKAFNVLGGHTLELQAANHEVKTLSGSNGAKLNFTTAAQTLSGAITGFDTVTLGVNVTSESIKNVKTLNFAADKLFTALKGFEVDTITNPAGQGNLNIGETYKVLNIAQNLGQIDFRADTVVQGVANAKTILTGDKKLTLGGDFTISQTNDAAALIINKATFDAKSNKLTIKSAHDLNLTESTLAVNLDFANKKYGSVDLQAADAKTITIDNKSQVVVTANGAPVAGGQYLVLKTNKVINVPTINISGVQFSGIANEMFKAETSSTAQELFVKVSKVKSISEVLTLSSTAKELVSSLENASSQQASDIRNLIFTSNKETASQITESLTPKDVWNIAQNVNANTINAVENVIGARLPEATQLASSNLGVAAGDSDKNLGVWAQAFGSQATQQEKDSFAGYKATTGGLTLGADTRAGDRAVFGLALSMANTNLKAQGGNSNGDKTKVLSYALTGYALYDLGSNVFNSTTLTFGTSKVKVKSKRGSNATGYATANGNYDSNGYSLSTLFGYNYALTPTVTLTPVAGVKYSKYSDGSYTESDAIVSNTNLGKQVVSSRDSDSFVGTVGLRVNAVTEFNDVKVQPSLHFLANQDFRAKNNSVQAKFEGAEAVKYSSPKTVKASYDLGMGFNVSNQGVDIGVGYNAHLKTKFTSHQGNLKVRVNL